MICIKNNCLPLWARALLPWAYLGRCTNYLCDNYCAIFQKVIRKVIEKYLKLCLKSKSRKIIRTPDTVPFSVPSRQCYSCHHVWIYDPQRVGYCPQMKNEEMATEKLSNLSKVTLLVKAGWIQTQAKLIPEAAFLTTALGRREATAALQHTFNFFKACISLFVYPNGLFGFNSVHIYVCVRVCIFFFGVFLSLWR